MPGAAESPPLSPEMAFTDSSPRVRQKRTARGKSGLRSRYSATNVRDRILERKDWESLVPKEVAGFVKQFGGVERVRELRKRDLGGGGMGD